MGRLSPDLSRYVRARWIKFLVERVLRPNPALRTCLADDDERGAFDYRDLIVVSDLATRISANDVQCESVLTWTRAIRRWVSEDVAPSPNAIRRALGALGVDWLVGMGRSGYHLHSLALLHALWALGNRKHVAAQARAIFDRSDDVRDVLDDRTFLRASEADLQRLEDAAFACGWHDARGAISIPTRCTLPRDFPASRELFAAWMLLDAAMTSKYGSLEQRLPAVHDGVARHVESWLAMFYQTDGRRAQKPRPSQRRKP